MEKNNYQEYRDNLAKEIRQEPDREERKSILAEAKITEEYQEAKRLKREAIVEKRENEDKTEDLLRYVQDNNLDRYDRSIVDSDLKKLFAIYQADMEDYKKNVLPNISSNLVNEIKSFIGGGREERISNLLKRERFDYESLLTSEGDDQAKIHELLEIILKAQTYDDALEQSKKTEIEFSGFTHDKDILDAKEYIYQAFGAELLQKCLLSRVKYSPDIVNLLINDTEYMLPVDVYRQWKAEIPEVHDKKFRAESFVLYNESRISRKYILTPINLYSFYGDRPEQFDYLANVPEIERMRLYKLGTISHEIAHQVFSYLMDMDKRKQWEDLIDSTQAITDYARMYQRHELKYNESFAEAIRLIITSSEYLKINFNSIYAFLKDNFPDIKSIN